MGFKPRCPFLCYLDRLLLVCTERLSIKGKPQLHGAAQSCAKEISLTCPTPESLVLPLHKGTIIWIQKLCPWDLLQIPNLPNQHKNRMKCLGSTEGCPRGRCTMGLASHSECMQTEMLVKKNRSSQRGTK